MGESPSQQEVLRIIGAELQSLGREPKLATVALSALARERRPDLAEQLLNCMQARHLCINVFHCSSVIAAHEKLGHWQMALSLLGRMPAITVAPNEFSYSATISACQKGCQWQLALSLLSCMPAASLKIDEVSCSAAISACEKVGQWQFALGLLSHMPAMRIVPNQISYNAAISACEKGSQWQLALSLLRCMLLAQSVPNEISYSAAISTCEKTAQWQQALSLLNHMFAIRLEPDVICFSAAMSACDRGNQWQSTVSLLSSMCSLGLVPDETCCTAAVSACEKRAQWRQALNIFAAMHEHQLEPTGILWGSVLGSMVRGTCSGQVPPTLERLRARWADRGHAVPSLAMEAGGGQGRCPQPRVLLQAPGVVALYKPSGMTSEKLRSDFEAILKAQGLASNAVFVSRLDAPTSGVMPLPVGGGQSGAAHWLQAQFASRQVCKQYLCLCAGESLGPIGSQDMIDVPLLIRGECEMQRVVMSPLGKPAQTQYEVLEAFPGPSNEDIAMLLRVRPLTGRTHQIRAHLAGMRRPLVGDKVYGGISTVCGVHCPRLFLHCQRISLVDLAGARFEPEAPLPDELLDVLALLRRNSQRECPRTSAS